MNTRDIRDDIMDIRSRFVRASDDEICGIVSTITLALDGDSNDAEHDALIDVAEFMGIAPDQEEYDDGN